MISRRSLLLGGAAVVAVAPLARLMRAGPSPLAHAFMKTKEYVAFNVMDTRGVWAPESFREAVYPMVEKMQNSPEFITRLEREWAAWEASHPAETKVPHPTDQGAA